MELENRQPRAWLLLAAVLAVVVASYASALDVPFVWDDHLLIEEEPRVRSLLPLSQHFGQGFWSNPTTHAVEGYFRPLVTLSYALDWTLWDGRPAGFHATNLLLHLICCALVFALARRGGASVEAAALGAALFGCLPRLTESATWVSGRTDLLAGAFGLAALCVHDTRAEGGGRRIAAAALLAAGLLAKEVSVAAAAGIVALELVARRRQGEGLRRSAVHLAPLAIAGLGYAVLRARAGAGPPDALALDGLDRVLLPFQALGTYAAMLLDPLRPSLVIGRVGVVSPVQVALGVGVAVAGGALALRAWRRGAAPFAWACAALGGVALLPVLHVLPLPLQVVAADRFLYLPAAALAAGLAVAAARLPGRARRVAGVAALVALPVFAAATHARNVQWSDEIGLWEKEAARAPRGSGVAWRELGTLHSWQGRPDEALGAYRKAFAAEQEFVRVQPRHRIDRGLMESVALALSETGRYDEALDIARQLVAEQPERARFRATLGAVHARNLDFDAAEREIGEAVRLHADYPQARALLNQVREAREAWRALPAPSPDEPAAVTAERARIFVQIGRLAEAERLWERVVQDPRTPPPLLQRAALYLVVRGDPTLAEQALVRLRASGAEPAAFEELERALAGRRALGETRWAALATP